MAANFFDSFQTMLADIGWAQYPPQMRPPQRRRSIAEKWLHAMAMLLWLLASLVVIAAGVSIIYFGIKTMMFAWSM